MTFRSVLIGEGTLVLQCGDVLLDAGHDIVALVSPGSDAQRWAASNGVPLVRSVADFTRDYGSAQFDYLFSIVNYSILRPEILKAPRRAAINYHDALLPRYAGINATSWAILSGERVHGITWHFIAEEVDAGDILLQREVPIDDTDTSLTLNIKCYEAALESFSELVSGLASDSIRPRVQDLSQRTYFGRDRVPPFAGVIDWTQTATEVDRLVRALDFGTYDNSLGAAKFMVDGVFYVCRSTRLASTEQRAPGTVLHAGPDKLRIACGSQAVDIESVATLAGEPVEIGSLLRDARIGSGDRLQLLAGDELARIEAACTPAAAHEAFWVRRLSALMPAEHPFVSSARRAGGDRRRSEVVDFSEVQRIVGQDQTAASVAAAVSVVASYIARIAGEEATSVAFASNATRAMSANSYGLASARVPLRVQRSSETLTELVTRMSSELSLVGKRSTYMHDAFARRAALATPPVALPLGISIGADDAREGTAPLTFVLAPDGTACHLEYDRDCVTDDESTRILAHLRALSGAISAEPSRRMSEMPLLSDDELDQVLHEWNDTVREYPHDIPLAALVEAQVSRTPDAPAVTFGADTLDYSQLNARANRLARELQRHGAGPGVLVGLSLHRSLEMMVALLAIIKSGAAYVPLDPMFPRDRLSYMMADSELGILITQTSLDSSFPEFAGAVLHVDAPTWDSTDDTDLGVNVGAEHLALVIYTSGSTGRPKGVQITRGALINLLWSMREWLNLSSADRLLAVTTISFDIAGVDIWLPWLVGARTILASREAAADGEQLRRLIEQHDITFLQATPITWRELFAAGWTGKSDLQAVCTGEAMPPEVAERLAPVVGRLWNLYGPTETTIWSTGVLVRDPGERISIGRPVANTQCYVLDEHLQPVPVGIIGELFIAGDGLARGYLKRPDLDAERFVANPFGARIDDRMYRTGDLARFHADGTIECLGRTDHQVKIRGFRIELGEIESALRTHPTVQQAVVVAREDVVGEKRLVGYVVPTDAGVNASELRAHLKESLPEYMVPAAILSLSEIPLTANGKIDRRALPSPDEASTRAESHIVTARTHVEKQLSEIWEELFNIPRVGVQENFFDLGGHSILAVKMMARIARVFGKQLPLNALFESPTIERLAIQVADADRTLGPHTIASIQAAGSRPPIFWIPGGAALGLFRLRNIVTQLGPDQPVYGLGSTPPTSLDNVESVEERASKYLELVRRVQPRGPYCFVGFCAGGLVAYEMAQQLRTQGESVPFVGMINCPFPKYPSSRFDKTLLRAQRLMFHLRTASANGTGVIGLVRNRIAQRPRTLRPFEREAGNELPETASPERDAGMLALDRLIDATVRVFARYKPQRYPGEICLFVSDEESYHGVSQRLDPRLHWRRQARSAQIRPFRGGHAELFDATESGSFAEILQLALEDALSRHSAS